MREGKGYRFRFWVNEKGREILKVDGVDKGVLVSELYREESLWFEKGEYISFLIYLMKRNKSDLKYFLKKC